MIEVVNNTTIKVAKTKKKNSNYYNSIKIPFLLLKIRAPVFKNQTKSVNSNDSINQHYDKDFGVQQASNWQTQGIPQRSTSNTGNLIGR